MTCEVGVPAVKGAEQRTCPGQEAAPWPPDHSPRETKEEEEHCDGMTGS